MLKVGWISDCHLDLTTDGIDRNDEIESVMLYAARWAVDNGCKFFVFGGDIFDNTTPSDEAIAIFIRVINVLHEAGIKIFVMDGNHEKKSRGKPSCLHFIQDLKAYKNLYWYSDIRTIKVFDNTYFTFFPHVNKATIPEKFKSPQEYVDYRADKIINKLDFTWQLVVFSHLNVRGVIPGTEEHMLKKSEVFLPDHFHTKNYLDKPFPTVVNAHIHTAQKSGWVQIVGSPVYVSFGEKEKEKYFACIDVPNKPNECAGIRLLPTPCRKFKEFNLEFKDGESVVFDSSSIEKTDVVKLNVRVPESLNFDWKAYRQELMKLCFHVLPINPQISRVRAVRNKKQSLNLKPNAAVKVFVEANKPHYPKTVLKLADQYIERLSS